MKWLSFVSMILISLLLQGCGEQGIFGLFEPEPMTREEASEQLHELLEDVKWSRDIVSRRANISLKKSDLMNTLPDISEYPIVVRGRSGGNRVVAEIFVSTEKSGSGSDGWMREAAEMFNDREITVSSGAIAQVAVRKIASGTGYQYIASRKYLPQGFSPSNHLWLKMTEQHGVDVTPIRERTVGNVAGIVMKKEAAELLTDKYGVLSVENIIDAVVQGELAMGYTNPYASSTGLNFLVSVLHSFSDAEETRMLDSDVVSTFEGFQQGVPYVAMTTLQMRDSVQNNGALDAFVMEYQTFARTNPSMEEDYLFIPFGIRHDNPLYGVAGASMAQVEVLKAFAEFLDSRSLRSKARQFGFDYLDDYDSAYGAPAGSLLIQAQQLWKEKKDAGRPVIALFLADTSGSMAGMRLNALKKALIEGSDFITDRNSIGLVTFNTHTNVLLPPKKFDLIQKSAFHAGVQDMQAGGHTAMYDGILVSLSELLKAGRDHPTAKLLLFVLTDGDSNQGYDFEGVRDVLEGTGVPIYTIGYAESIDELKQLSGLVEAASRNAAEGSVSYTIGTLLNAQM
ncbi:MAG: VWA domain-containing protein [Gammaproteobacteria bacterium]|nr:VWA domain-containing protein [Gammaproteobacteria bacterium]